MRNENVRNALKTNAILSDLHLGAFATIDEDVSIVANDVLCCWISTKCRHSGSTS